MRKIRRPRYAFPAKRRFFVKVGKPRWWLGYATYDEVEFLPFNEHEAIVKWYCNVHIKAKSISVGEYFECDRDTPRTEIINAFREGLQKVLPADLYADI